jgi:hypothetical protein
MAKKEKAVSSAPNSGMMKTQGKTSVNADNHGVTLKGASVNADATRSSVAKSHSLGGRTA